MTNFTRTGDYNPGEDALDFKELCTDTLIPKGIVAFATVIGCRARRAYSNPPPLSGSQWQRLYNACAEPYRGCIRARTD